MMLHSTTTITTTTTTTTAVTTTTTTSSSTTITDVSFCASIIDRTHVQEMDRKLGIG